MRSIFEKIRAALAAGVALALLSFGAHATDIAGVRLGMSVAEAKAAFAREHSADVSGNRVPVFADHECQACDRRTNPGHDPGDRIGEQGGRGGTNGGQHRPEGQRRRLDRGDQPEGTRLNPTPGQRQNAGTGSGRYRLHLQQRQTSASRLKRQGAHQIGGILHLPQEGGQCALCIALDHLLHDLSRQPDVLQALLEFLVLLVGGGQLHQQRIDAGGGHLGWRLERQESGTQRIQLRAGQPEQLGSRARPVGDVQKIGWARTVAVAYDQKEWSSLPLLHTSAGRQGARGRLGAATTAGR